jgi:hypothetical protein
MVKLTTLKVNQTIVHEDGKSTLFSYDTPICTKEVDGSITLYSDWDYSATTSKYRSQFLNGETTKQTLKKLMSGTYVLRRAYGN